MRDVVERVAAAASKMDVASSNYYEEEAKLWESRFVEFNYKLRRLTAEYADVSSKPSPSNKQPT